MSNIRMGKTSREELDNFLQSPTEEGRRLFSVFEAAVAPYGVI